MTLPGLSGTAGAMATTVIGDHQNTNDMP